MTKKQIELKPKQIDLPVDKIKDLKMLAVEAGMSFKAWIEHVILYQLK